MNHQNLTLRILLINKLKKVKLIILIKQINQFFHCLPKIMDHEIHHFKYENL